MRISELSRSADVHIWIAMAAARGEERGLELADLSLVSPFPRLRAYQGQF